MSFRDVRTVFLDRDGVINEKMPEGQYVTQWAKFRLLPGVNDAIGRLNRAGMRVIVVSNQRGIALGLYTSADVETIHAALRSLLEDHGAHLDGFYFCPHDKSECNCRKPLPGLFEQAAAEFSDIQAPSSVMIGDSLSDIEFGRRLGMRCIFIDGTLAHQKPGANMARQLADAVCKSLPDAVDWLIGSPVAESR
jgi:D-glycero-D-manno-heptose 1,7-bisphosphate phosphatase